MSYNYDQNPWDDNYNAQAGAVGYGQSMGGYNASTGYGASSSGYSNPSAQYQDGWGEQTGTQYGASSYSDPQQAGQPLHSDQSPNNEAPLEASQGYSEPNKAPPTALGRFLRAHVPMCGTCMDTMAPLFELIFKYVNRELLVSKVFYFFFYSAFGSLFPLMGVYFKQLGMNPSQVGIITGVRPFIEIFSAPFWNSLAERFQKSKVLLLFSILSWIVFTYPLAHIRPPASACVAFNDTDYVLYVPYSGNELSNYDVGQLDEAADSSASTTTPSNTNELFMNKMPNSREGKDEILVNEENVNDQGRRRRRKRSYLSSHFGGDQIIRPALQEARSRYAYAVEEAEEGYESSAPVELDIDLERDFDDMPLRSVNSLESREDSFFDQAGASSEYNSDLAGGQDELEHQMSYGKKLRQKRHLLGEDDVLGESEANESEDAIRPKYGKKRHEASDESAGDESEDSDAESKGDEENANADEAELSARTKHEQHQTEKSVAESGESEREKEEKPKAAQEAVKTKRVFRQRHKTPPTHIVGMSPITVEYAVNYNKDKHSQFVTPMFSTIVYKLNDIKEVFLLLLLLVCLGEFFSAPAVTIADSITLSNLGDNTDLYGRQRMFGSIGWGITLLFVGMALDNAKTIPGHPCGPHQRERSYTVCFTIFSLLMGCAFFTATQFNLRYSKKVTNGAGGQAVVTKTGENSTVVTTTIDGAASTNVDDLYASTRPREIFNTAPPVNAPPTANSKEKFEFLDKWKSAVFAQSTGKLPEWVNVFRQFSRTMHLTYLFITWFLGCGVGLVFTFLFWHLQEVGPGGTPTLFGICSVINHISEILAYFFSSYFIKRFGHTKVLSVGLGCNVIRFLYVAFLSNPYYALPFELVQGITHAACFAACCSYMSHVSKPELKASTQGVMQGLHNGIGRACGAVIGGYMINAIGSRAAFCIYGLLSGCVLGGLLYIRKKVSLEEAEVKVDDHENLGDYGAPQGVPTTIPNKMVQSAPQQDIDYQW